MDMESGCYVNELKTLVESGATQEVLIDDAVKRILKVKFELGLFEDLTSTAVLKGSISLQGNLNSMMPLYITKSIVF